MFFLLLLLASTITSPVFLLSFGDLGPVPCFLKIFVSEQSILAFISA